MTVSSVSSLFSSANLFSLTNASDSTKVKASQTSALFDTDADDAGVSESQLSQGTALQSSGDPANLQGSNLASDVVGALIQFLQSVEGSASTTASATAGTTTATTADATTDASSDAASAPPTAAQQFAALDTDGDGVVSEAEFVAGRPDGISEDQAKSLFSKLDPDGTGSLTEAQFASGMQTQQAAAGGGPVHGHHHGGGGGASSSDADTAEDSVFSALDTNQDGVISAAEYAAGAPTSMASDAVTNLFSSIDTDTSGGISLDEFKAHINGSDSATSTTATTASTTSSTSSDTMLSGISNADDTTVVSSGSSSTSNSLDVAVEDFLQQMLSATNAYNSTFTATSLMSTLGIAA